MTKHIKKLLLVAVGVGMSLAAVSAFASGAGVSVASPVAIAVPACPVFGRSLFMGVTGSDVTALQDYLNVNGFLNVSATGYFGPLTQAAVAKWQAQGGVVALDGFGSGTFGPLSRAYFSRSYIGSGSGSATTTADIQQLNAPGSVTLAEGGIAEVRNASFYFTLADVATSSATIDITPVGCWNSFPSDPPPTIRCMIAVVPTPPQTLSVGEKYSFGNYGITLTAIDSGTATFAVQ